MRRAVATGFITTTTTAGVLFAAPAAHADTSDVAFLDQITKNGITFRDANDAIVRGKAVCLFMDDGGTPMGAIQGVAGTNPKFTTYDAAAFTGAAIGAYCPKYLPELPH